MLVLEIRERRIANAVTIPWLAEAAKVSVRTIIRIEQQPGYEPGVFAAYRIANALGASVDSLIRHLPDGTASGEGFTPSK